LTLQRRRAAAVKDLGHERHVLEELHARDSLDVAGADRSVRDSMLLLSCKSLNLKIKKKTKKFSKNRK